MAKRPETTTARIRLFAKSGRLAAAMMAALVHASMNSASAANAGCETQADKLGVARIVEIDAQGGPIFGSYTKQEREDSFLGAKEVVLTFDDGPMPWITRSILDTLDEACTKATFFSVGRMALAYPEVVKEVAARGHTLGTHTMTHPFNMFRLKPDVAHDQIERGFAAVAAAANTPIAPFFRFPGLADSHELMAYLQSRGIAAFTVDVVSNDSYIGDPKRLTERTMREIERNNGGIVLFHDIKRSTAKALPEILRQLKAGGFSIVHLTSKTPMQPLPQLAAAMSGALAKAASKSGKPATVMPFYGTTGPVVSQSADPVATQAAPSAAPERPNTTTAATTTTAGTMAAATAANSAVPISQLAPAPRQRVASTKASRPIDKAEWSRATHKVRAGKRSRTIVLKATAN